MSTLISTVVSEQSSAKFTAAFTDESGAAVSLSSATWKLTDTLGNVVNARAAVSITPATSVTIVLTGDDLILGQDAVSDVVLLGRERVLTIQGLYDSTAGTGLKFKAEARFQIENLLAVS